MKQHRRTHVRVYIVHFSSHKAFASSGHRSYLSKTRLHGALPTSTMSLGTPISSAIPEISKVDKASSNSLTASSVSTYGIQEESKTVGGSAKESERQKDQRALRDETSAVLAGLKKTNYRTE